MAIDLARVRKRAAQLQATINRALVVDRHRIHGSDAKNFADDDARVPDGEFGGANEDAVGVALDRASIGDGPPSIAFELDAVVPEYRAGIADLGPGRFRVDTDRAFDSAACVVDEDRGPNTSGKVYPCAGGESRSPGASV